MSIVEAEEKLLNEWESAARKRGGDGFIRDGIVCEEEYLKSNPKIVFVLKEVNSPGASGWRVQDSMMGDENWRMWNNVARWVYGVHHRDSIPKWRDDDGFITCNSKDDAKLADFRKDALKSICSMNLKKVPGGGTVNWEELEGAAKNNEPMIQKQYKLYDPDLTICGGTEYLFTKAMGYTIGDGNETNSGIKEWRKTNRGVCWYERDSEKYVVSYNHPSARATDAQLFYGFVDAINEIYDGAK